MLKNDSLCICRHNPFRARGTTWIAQRRLSFYKNDVRIQIAIAAYDGMFHFSGDEIVKCGIKHKAVFRSLHPTGLPGVNHFGLVARLSHSLYEEACGCPFSKCTIRSQYSN